MKIGNALEIIPELTETFDLIFIDADKTNYSNYYNLTFDKLNKGGYFIADNVLWSGKVISEPDDKTANAIIKFNRHVNNDPRTENIILPVRDGLSLIRKSN